MSTTAVRASGCMAAAAASGSASQKSPAPGKSLGLSRARRTSATVTRQPSSAAWRTSGIASWPAPHTIRRVGGRIGSCRTRAPSSSVRRGHVEVRRIGLEPMAAGIRSAEQVVTRPPGCWRRTRPQWPGRRPSAPRTPRTTRCSPGRSPRPHRRRPSGRSWPGAARRERMTSRPMRATSSSRQPPEMLPIGSPSAGMSRRAPACR